MKDLCTRKIAGYAFSDQIDTQPTLAALYMAYHRRRSGKGIIFYSDRGVQYAAKASLKQEYATLQAEGWKISPALKEARAKMIELLTAKNNVKRILGVTEKQKNREHQQGAR